MKKNDAVGRRVVRVMQFVLIVSRVHDAFAVM